jgi:hypothetical protein
MPQVQKKWHGCEASALSVKFGKATQWVASFNTEKDAKNELNSQIGNRQPEKAGAGRLVRQKWMLKVWPKLWKMRAKNHGV